jgi:hypothetical protein
MPVPSVPDPAFRPIEVGQAREGWRAWRVSKDLPAYGLAPKLHSATHAYTWHPKRKAEADCPWADEHEGVPGTNCSCGFYSAKTLKHLMQMGYHAYHDVEETGQFTIVGQVACWGKVVEGTQGWRSQYCYPVYLMLPYEMGAEFGQRIKQAYGCRVRLLNFLKEPGEITDAFLEDMMAGRPHRAAPLTMQHKGRRVVHKQLRYQGHTRSEPWFADGRKLIEVTWDVTPTRTVTIAVDHLEFEAV